MGGGAEHLNQRAWNTCTQHPSLCARTRRDACVARTRRRVWKAEEVGHGEREMGEQGGRSRPTPHTCRSLRTAPHKMPPLVLPRAAGVQARTRPAPPRRRGWPVRVAAEAGTPPPPPAPPPPSTPWRRRFALPPRPQKEPLAARLLSAFLGTSTVPYRYVKEEWNWRAHAGVRGARSLSYTGIGRALNPHPPLRLLNLNHTALTSPNPSPCSTGSTPGPSCCCWWPPCSCPPGRRRPRGRCWRVRWPG